MPYHYSGWSVLGDILVCLRTDGLAFNQENENLLGPGTRLRVAVPD